MASSQQHENWTEDINCPVCLDVFTDPVSLECGHNFCRSCITGCWGQGQRNLCPECRQEFPDRKFKVNRLIVSLAEKARKLNLNPGEGGSKFHCEEHQEELKLFCDTDKKLICLICRDARKHREHRFLPIKEAVEIYKDELKSALESLSEKKSMFLETELKQIKVFSEVREQSSSLQTHIVSEFSKMRQILSEKEQRFLRDLRKEEERILDTMEKNLQKIQETLYSIEEELSKLQKQTEQGDGVKFLKEVARHKRRTGEDYCELLLAEDTLSVGRFKGPVQYTVWRELIGAIEPAPANVTLDPCTANPWLILSEDRTSVRDGDLWQPLPATSERFDTWPCVLGSEGFISGRYYWEVDVGTKTWWGLGVARESAERQGRMDATPEAGYWMMWLAPERGYVARSCPVDTLLTLSADPRKVGVFLDYEGGQVSFYNAGNMSHLHTFSHHFTEVIFPIFSPGLTDDGKNSAPLTICEVKGH
ncbi:zinc-binding protein A33-like isoform X1 [Scyliorhinus canicula]|uniref:zinc-binding protein A33-like isoform X1 n=1 Tax=Scyliorhinus canicula TaxID=7830 RepID=UPI0018F4A5CF|nr:zinc-binding protein A33-like isoform X1 [Scyliorhinus canicula]